MNFDFNEQFKDYSNFELLKITKRPEEYQQAAVQAAARILSERSVSEDENTFAEMHCEEMANRSAAEKAQLNFYKNKAVDFFEPVIHPGTEVQPVKWLNIFLLVLGIQYLYNFFYAVLSLLDYFKCTSCSLTIALIPFINLWFIALIFYLLFRKRRWGWILLFADCIFSVITRLSQSYIYFNYGYPFDMDDATFILLLVFKLFFIYFLWKKEVADFFSVSDKTKKQTAIAATGSTLLFITTLHLLYR